MFVFFQDCLKGSVSSWKLWLMLSLYEYSHHLESNISAFVWCILLLKRLHIKRRQIEATVADSLHREWCKWMLEFKWIPYRYLSRALRHLYYNMQMMKIYMTLDGSEWMAGQIRYSFGISSLCWFVISSLLPWGIDLDLVVWVEF